jgi:hypothetical protein
MDPRRTINSRRIPDGALELSEAGGDCILKVKTVAVEDACE